MTLRMRVFATRIQRSFSWGCAAVRARSRAQRSLANFADFAERLWQLLSVNHLGREIVDLRQIKRERKAEEERAKRRADDATRGRRARSLVRTSIFEETREQSELLQLDPIALDVIAQAFQQDSETDQPHVGH